MKWGLFLTLAKITLPSWVGRRQRFCIFAEINKFIIMGFFHQSIGHPIMSGVSREKSFSKTHIYEYADENEC
jgi:hypothetical protein